MKNECGCEDMCEDECEWGKEGKGQKLGTCRASECFIAWAAALSTSGADVLLRSHVMKTLRSVLGAISLPA